MASYIAKADIEDVFGKENIETWSNLDGESGADEARIATAIEVAEEDLENRFRDGRYSLPFSPVSRKVKDWCAKLAGLWLFENRPVYNEEEGEGFRQMHDDIDADIDRYTSGQRRLECALVEDGMPGCPIVVQD